MKKKMVKTILIIFVVISLIILVRFYMLGNMARTGKAPGLVAGRLSACSDKPNCVSSENSDDPSHYISPLRYSASMSDETMDLIKGSFRRSEVKLRLKRGRIFLRRSRPLFLGLSMMWSVEMIERITPCTSVLPHGWGIVTSGQTENG